MSNGITAWSYSRYNDYKLCPLKFKLKYIDKMPTAGSPAMDRGNTIHNLAENYVKSTRKIALPKHEGKPVFAGLAAEIEHLRANKAIAEMPWGFRSDWSWTGKPNWFGAEVWFRMKADAAVSYDDDTGMVVDWKTGRKYSENQDQIELFGAVALQRFPNWSEVDVRLWYTDAPADDNEIQRVIDRKEGAAILKVWERRALPMFKDKRWAPTPNDKCKWCDFRKDSGGPCKF